MPGIIRERGSFAANASSQRDVARTIRFALTMTSRYVKNAGKPSMAGRRDMTEIVLLQVIVIQLFGVVILLTIIALKDQQ